MIPKIIHYGWLGGNPIPAETKKYINSWKKFMPDYQLKCWSEKNFDIDSVQLVKEACKAKKWAFAVDYIRLYALYHEGGIYFDTDVMLYQSLEPLLDAGFVSAVEYHPKKRDLQIHKIRLDETGKRISAELKIPAIGILSAVICSQPKHIFIKEALDFYKDKSLKSILLNNFTIPSVLALTAEKYGYRYKNKEQFLSNDIHLYDTNTFSNYDQFSSKSYCVHFCAGSWTNDSLRKKIMLYIKSHRFSFILYIWIIKIKHKL
jgi:mannosyltransferase OCH1-like enzyme